mgnify:CR=1 FL=1
MTNQPSGRPAAAGQRVFFVVSVARDSHGLLFLSIEEMAHFIEEIAHFIEKAAHEAKFVIYLQRLDRERSRRLWGFVAVPMASRSGLSGLFAPWGWQGIQPPASHPLKTTPRPPAAAPL